MAEKSYTDLETRLPAACATKDELLTEARGLMEQAYVVIHNMLEESADQWSNTATCKSRRQLVEDLRAAVGR